AFALKILVFKRHSNCTPQPEKSMHPQLIKINSEVHYSPKVKSSAYLNPNSDRGRKRGGADPTKFQPKLERGLFREEFSYVMNFLTVS
ncbi:MAG: hypothetical protein ACWGNP_03300, partial [Candidatus Bathyarchaeia archaeon]